MAAALQTTADNQRARERAAFRAYFDLVSQRPWIFRIVREAEFLAPGEFRPYYERLARGYARGVRVAQLAGEVDPRYDPEVIAYIYTGLARGLPPVNPVDPADGAISVSEPTTTLDGRDGGRPASTRSAASRRRSRP